MIRITVEAISPKTGKTTSRIGTLDICNASNLAPISDIQERKHGFK